MGDPKKVGALVKVTFQWRKQATSKRTNIPWIVSDCCEGVKSGEGGGGQRVGRGVPYTGGQDSFSKGRKGIRGSRDLRGNSESKGLMKAGTGCMFADQIPVHEWRASSSMRLERQQRSLSCWEESRTHSKCDGNHEEGRCFGRSILAAVGEAGDPKRIITEGREAGGCSRPRERRWWQDQVYLCE